MSGADAAAAHAAVVARAEELRGRRAALYADLAAGRTDVAALVDLGRTDMLVGEVKVLPALESLPGARKTDTRRALADLGVGPRTRLCDLDGPTAAALAGRFPLPAHGGAPA